MPSVTDYLKGELGNFPSYELKPEDEEKIKISGLDRWITNKLLVKRFRKAKVAEKTAEEIFKKVQLSTKENKPLYLILGFGGYKNFWNSSYPEVDWAEFFNLRFMSEYVAPVLVAYAPGVSLEYESEDIILPLIDNYPEESLEAYARSFKELTNIYSKQLPTNFKINYIRSQEQLNTSKLFDRINELLPAKKEAWRKLSPEEKEQHLHRTPANIMWRGKVDWTSLTDEEKQAKIVESKIINETYYDADYEFRGKYFEGGNHIPLVFSFGKTVDNEVTNWVTLGSTFSSMVDFWVGRGILEDRESKFVPRIVSHRQYDEVKDKLQTVATDIIPLKNFNSIEVYQGQLNF